MEKDTIQQATVFLATNAGDDLYGEKLLQVFDDNGKLIAVDPVNLKAKIESLEGDVKNWQELLEERDKKLAEREREIVKLRTEKARLATLGYNALTYALRFVPIPLIGKSQKSKEARADYQQAQTALNAFSEECHGRAVSFDYKNQ